ncbi:MAG: hypothetical protein GQF41_0400 [Candidatus Rifleibacterium amylolyticum]|nr:MAG: hypothetical protein GQF41_0400 [Candidatus Rifleibacterium amylolyticum]
MQMDPATSRRMTKRGEFCDYAQDEEVRSRRLSRFSKNQLI